MLHKIANLIRPGIEIWKFLRIILQFLFSFDFYYLSILEFLFLYIYFEFIHQQQLN